MAFTPQIVEARAPNRILDFGGWTDTHFARRGRVVNLAVALYAHVTAITREQPGATIHILDYNDRIEVADVVKQGYGQKHDLLLAALKVMKVSSGLDVFITADVPPGCSTGSSAAVTVALLKALSVIAKKPLDPHELARLAHRIETVELGAECGVQDQIASAHGGLSYIAIDNYPEARVSPVPVSQAAWRALEERLLLVYEGAGHLSSDVHKKVIAGMNEPGSSVPRLMEGLCAAADQARDALIKGDLAAVAQAMNENNSLQKQLHPDIATVRLERIERLAMANGAVGAMINGAGGGGSITLLCRPGMRAVAARALRSEGFAILPATIAWEGASAWAV